MVTPQAAISEAELGDQSFTVAADKCIRCASCSTIGPELFGVADDGAHILRQPTDEIEFRLGQAALLNCPTKAIGQRRGLNASAGVQLDDRSRFAASSPGETRRNDQDDLLDGSIYYRLFEEAEKARWRMTDIPWAAIEKDKVTEKTLHLVREVVFSELTTFSAADRFFKHFADDVDFTQWVAVWLYEETKHPQALMCWLKHFGESFTTDFMLQGRETYPMVNSRMGTLVMNIISEMMATAGYMRLHHAAREPVLKLIARNLASDEARHASSFYSYARKTLERSRRPDEERLRALEVLYFWLMNGKQVKHPINQFHQRLSDNPELAEYATRFNSEGQHNRVCRMIGTLIGKPLLDKQEIAGNLRELSAVVRRG